MFTGIIETIGIITSCQKKLSNTVLKVQSSISNLCHVDQSIAHDGICLTLTDIEDSSHTIVAIEETLNRTTLKNWQPGSQVNLERCLRVDGRFDGHFVQGHVDDVGTCVHIDHLEGSMVYTFAYNEVFAPLLVHKGSICINGISLTCLEPSRNTFQVALIPYTIEHTTMNQIIPGMQINLEFDIIGKYITRRLQLVNDISQDK